MRKGKSSVIQAAVNALFDHFDYFAVYSHSHTLDAVIPSGDDFTAAELKGDRASVKLLAVGERAAVLDAHYEAPTWSNRC